MEFMGKNWRYTIGVALVIFSLSGPLYGVHGPYENIRQPPEHLLVTSESIIGQPLSYPREGAAKITALIVTIEPGEVTQLHKHPVPLFGYVISGEVVVEYDGKGSKRFAAGDAFMEAIDWWHKGKNVGDVPARLLAVYMGSEKLSNVIPK